MDRSPPGSVCGIYFAGKNGLPFPPPGDLPDPGIEPASLVSPALAGRFFSTTDTLATSDADLRFWSQVKFVRMAV